MQITLSHGGGGFEMDELIKLFRQTFEEDFLNDANDAGIVPSLDKKLVISTDSFVLQPIFLQGTDIGKLCVCGSVNDVCVAGGRPKYLSLAFIIEEGFLLSDLEKICKSIKKEAKNAGVRLVCGDTKVVPKGFGGRLYINTTCVGEQIISCSTSLMKKGDLLIISRDLGAHGASVLAQRNELSCEVISDCKSLHEEIFALIKANLSIKCMRDITRGGLAAVLNEWSEQSGFDLLIKEDDLRFKDEVLGICELFGFEPTHLACEGAFIACVGAEDAQKAREILASFNPNACIIGEVLDNGKARVILQTSFNTKRLLERPKGELLPRIC